MEPQPKAPAPGQKSTDRMPQQPGQKSTDRMPQQPGQKSTDRMPQQPGQKSTDRMPQQPVQKGGSSMIEVARFDMTEQEVKIWETRVGMVVGLILMIGAGSLLVFGAIKLINWIMH
jgi:hypothetical protein